MVLAATKIALQNAPLLASIQDRMHFLIESEARRTYSKQVDPGPVPKKRTPHKLGPDHPWRSNHSPARALEDYIKYEEDYLW